MLNVKDKTKNNPKLKEPRMPLILNKEQEELWLTPIQNEKDLEIIEEIVYIHHPRAFLLR